MTFCLSEQVGKITSSNKFSGLTQVSSLDTWVFVLRHKNGGRNQRRTH